MRIEMIDIDDLRVDTRAQRATHAAHMAKLASGFDPNKVGAIIISERPEGRFILDGQHRVGGGKKHGYKGKLPAVIHEGLTIADEAQLFLALNENKPIPPLEKFNAEVTAGDAIAVGTQRIVTECGFTVAQASLADRNISSVSTLMSVFRSKGGGVLRETLETIAEAYPETPIRSRSKRFLEAVSAVLNLPLSSSERLVLVLKKTSAGAILAEADALAEIHRQQKGKLDLEIVMRQYNKGLKKSEHLTFP